MSLTPLEVELARPAPRTRRWAKAVALVGVVVLACAAVAFAYPTTAQPAATASSFVAINMTAMEPRGLPNVGMSANVVEEQLCLTKVSPSWTITHFATLQPCNQNNPDQTKWAVEANTIKKDGMCLMAGHRTFEKPPAEGTRTEDDGQKVQLRSCAEDDDYSLVTPTLPSDGSGIRPLARGSRAFSTQYAAAVVDAARSYRYGSRNQFIHTAWFPASHDVARRVTFLPQQFDNNAVYMVQVYNTPGRGTDDGRRLEFLPATGQLQVIKYSARHTPKAQNWANVPPACGKPDNAVKCSFTADAATYNDRVVKQSSSAWNHEWICNTCDQKFVQCNGNSPECCCHAAMTWNEHLEIKAKVDRGETVTFSGIASFNVRCSASSADACHGQVN